jgi:hypothetical protein
MMDDAKDPYCPRPAIEMPPPPSSELRLGTLDMLKPLPSPREEREVVDRLPVTADNV